MKLIAFDDDKGVVECAGMRKTVSLVFIEEPCVGDYLIIHAGFAIQKLYPDAVFSSLYEFDNRLS
ncbi:HypC/HybG/HupF family hydrogenase formation chaperone [candidate division KSB1 bacterium]